MFKTFVSLLSGHISYIVFVILHVIPVGKVVYHKALIQFQQDCILRRWTVHSEVRKH